MDPRLQRTKFAAHSATLAEQFEAALGFSTVSGYRLEMTVPEGSTGGGVQALQHIRLVPGEEQPKGARTYVVGNASRASKTAELRSLEYVDQVCLQRFGERTGFDRAQYDACMTEAGKFLTAWGMTVIRASAPPPQSTAPTTASTSAPEKMGKALPRSHVLLLVVWTIAVFAIGVVVGVLATQSRLGH